jgi:hypothetical protein
LAYLSALRGFPVAIRTVHVLLKASLPTRVGYPILSAREMALSEYLRAPAKSDFVYLEWVPRALYHRAGTKLVR